LHIRIYYYPFGVWVSPGLITRFLEAVLIGFLLLRRLPQSVRNQKELALDVKQAQQVQQVILPEHRIVLPGIEIESEYRPAREVGGDFFQIIPNPIDDSLLIVAGDVAGKGLQAGMLVALLIGAIRTAAETDADPVSILAALNRRLFGRADARATCLALQISADGTVMLANAGHLPPYLNGVPIEIEGSLPLGVLEDFSPSAYQFRLGDDDRLLLLSDGIAEATDQNGKLFGFDSDHAVQQAPYFYSSRSAAIGSMCAARRAGIQLASSAMPVIAAVMLPKTHGSSGRTW
jgi:serine phosphatase RsbU (regulator of sigma subunit)